jgi:hypothetical protein
MCQMSWNLGASTSWNPQGLSRPVMGLLLLFLLPPPPRNTYNEQNFFNFRLLSGEFNIIAQNYSTKYIFDQKLIKEIKFEYAHTVLPFSHKKKCKSTFQAYLLLLATCHHLHSCITCRMRLSDWNQQRDASSWYPERPSTILPFSSFYKFSHPTKVPYLPNY